MVKNKSTYNDTASLVGRIILGALFTFAGVNKIVNFSGTAQYMANFGMPLANFFLVLSIILLVGGGVFFLLGYKTRIVAFLFAGFVLLATLIFHTDLSNMAEFGFFIKNLMIIGGLLHISSTGAGRLSLDAKYSK